MEEPCFLSTRWRTPPPARRPLCPCCLRSPTAVFLRGDTALMCFYPCFCGFGPCAVQRIDLLRCEFAMVEPFAAHERR